MEWRYNGGVDAPVAISQPDWEAISHEVLCPLCEYNLRGLTQPRCPECGFVFVWQEVVDPKVRPHPYLFEHHPKKNIRSFFRTVWGSIFAIRFWKSLSPAQPSRPFRLFVYWVLTSLITALIVLGAYAGRAIYAEMEAGWTLFNPYSPYSMKGLGSYTLSDFWRSAGWIWESGMLVPVFYSLGAWLLWPWLTLLTLGIFRISMSRAKIRMIHVVRCIIYTVDVGVWLGLIAGMAVIFLVPSPFSLISGSGLFWFRLSSELCIAAAILLVVITYRLWAGYRYYLRFRHPFWTVLASQVILVLLFFTVISMWYNLAPTSSFFLNRYGY